MLTLRGLANRFIAERSGVITLMTIGFMAGAGVVIVFALASIGFGTSIYNAQYQATQTAAYSAASTIKQSQGGGQSIIDCSIPDPASAWCASGPAFDAAEQSLYASLGSKATNPSAFGLFYNGINRAPGVNEVPLYLSDANKNPNRGIYVYNLTAPFGVAKAGYENFKNNPVPGQTPCFNSNQSGAAQRLCWQVNDGNWLGAPIFQSGVVVRTITELRLPPGCSNFCFKPVRLVATAGATSSSPETP